VIFYVVPDAARLARQLRPHGEPGVHRALTNRVLWTRFIDLEQFKRRVLVLGAGEAAATINRKMRRKAGPPRFPYRGVRAPGDEEAQISASRS
jgi:hypothetical protein